MSTQTGDPFGWPDPLESIPFIPPKTWWGKLFDTPGKARMRRKGELARRRWEQTQRFHNDKCNVWHHDRWEYEFYNGLPLSNGRPRPMFYIPSAEGTRCTCWKARYTPEEYMAEKRKMAEQIKNRIVLNSPSSQSEAE